MSLEEDLRGRHGNNAIKLLPEARKAVVDFIISKDASESHYRRARRRKKYFDCNVSMRKMWRDFVAENPNFKTNRSVSRNKGPVISFSTFRKIFRDDLSDVLSFRKARVDTCQYCNQTINKINVLSQYCNFRFRVFFRASSLQNEVGDPPFFYISDITNSSSFNGKICREKSMLKKFHANVLKDGAY